ncbi:MAG: hypothetical protein JWO25_417 [Alphaproteobacteria bacterium]|nr:hypothetical protein [Alphaproteobacteria bacterium]
MIRGWQCGPDRAWGDTDRIDDAVLALLYLGLHGDRRTWKGFDWDAMDRLHERGMIFGPKGKAKSVVFAEEGALRSEQLFNQMFGRPGGSAAP